MVRSKGFTLVELLVSLAVLAILLTIVILAINIPKQLIAARDLQRKMDVKQLGDSMSSYYTSQKSLPPQDFWYSLPCGKSNAPSQLPVSLQPFMSSFSCDPTSEDPYYYETLDINCQPCSDVICHKFRILTTLENPNDQAIPVVGCDADLGCGPYSQDGLPYNYGVSLGCPLKTDSLAWQTAQTSLQRLDIPQAGKILEVQLLFDDTNTPKISLLSLTQKNGYPNPPTAGNPEYKIIFLDLAGNPVYSTDFSSPKAIGFEITEDIGPVTKSTFALTLPWFSQIDTIRIQDQSGTLIATAAEADITIQNNTPSFITIPGSSVIPKISSGLYFDFVSTVLAQESGDHIDMVFIGDGFTTQASLTVYHQKVNEYIKELLTFEPFKARAASFNFHYVDATQNFNCLGHPNFYYCLGPVTGAVNTAGVPWDNIYIIVNSQDYRGAAYYDGIAYGTIGGSGSLIYVHELGHSFGILADEYLASNSYEKSDKNCYPGTPPNPAWAGIVQTSDYYQGCNYSNWYRSSDNSIMKTLEARYFNPISQKYINDEINRHLGSSVIPTLIPVPTSTPIPTPTPPVPTVIPSPTPVSTGLINQVACICNDTFTPRQCVNFSCSDTSKVNTTCTSLCSTHSGVQQSGACVSGHIACSGATPTPVFCPSFYAYSLNPQSIDGHPGDSLPGTFYIRNYSDPSCAPVTYTINSSVPAGFSITGLPDSVTVAGNYATTAAIINHVPSTAAGGDYTTEIWVNSNTAKAKTILHILSPTPTSVPANSPDELTCYCWDNTNQTQCTNINCTSSTEITTACTSRCSTHGGMKAGGCTDNHPTCTGIVPTSVPTPTPNPCSQGFTSSLIHPLIETPADRTVSQTLTIRNDNPVGCGSRNFAISYSHPAVFGIFNLPPSVSLSGGQVQNIDFSIIVTPSATVGDHLTQFWVNSSSPVNGTVRVTASAPTPTPSTNMFSNLSVRSYGDYALFKFTYAGWGLSDFRVDVAEIATALYQTVGPNAFAMYGFAFGSGTPMDPSNQATPTSVRAIIQKTPQSWSKWTCGRTIYWRMYKSSQLTISSPIQTTVVDCATQIDILPWEPWYSAIYYGVYDARYDPDQNGVVNWYDYWTLVDQTRLR